MPISEPSHASPALARLTLGTVIQPDAGRFWGLAAIVASALMTATACGGPATGRPDRPSTTSVAVFTLAPRTGTPPLAVSVPADAGQVVLRMPGDLDDPDQLVAELARVDAPDGARRWPVDPATASADGVRVSVTLPAYALAPGDYVVTVWRGDAEVVQRYALRVVP